MIVSIIISLVTLSIVALASRSWRWIRAYPQAHRGHQVEERRAAQQAWDRVDWLEGLEKLQDKRERLGVMHPDVISLEEELGPRPQ